MRIIIVGREQDELQGLTDGLTEEDFEVISVDSASAVLSLLKEGEIHFLLAEASLLTGDLAREILKRCPLTRLVALSSNPTGLGLVQAITSGAVDYFPRLEGSFDELLQTLLSERQRLRRWQRALLSAAPPSASLELAGEEGVDMGPQMEMLD